jgi:hypothetical protein
MDMSAFCMVATHQTRLLAGASCDVRALVCVRAADVGEHGVEASLRLWTPVSATLVMLRERSPVSRELHDQAIQLDKRTVEYAAGRWTDGAREYELALALPARPSGDDMLAARLTVVVDGEDACRAPIAVTWTDDERLVAAATQAPGPTCAAAEAVADLPTSPSPDPPRRRAVEVPEAARCSACGLRAMGGDRFCERCGHTLAGAQKS